MADDRRRQRRTSSLGALLLGALGATGVWFYWSHDERDRMIAEQRRIIAALEQKLDRAWAEEIVGDVKVEDVRTEAGGPVMDLVFYQYEPGTERAILRRPMTLPGEEFYIDALVVKFERRFVETGDGLRGKSLLLFRRAFGDRQKPIDGVPLFRQTGASPIPEVAQVDPQPSEFERQLWARFWDLANDPRQAAEAGIRIAQGEAPHVKATKGQVYKLTLRASGGLEITPRLPGALVGADGPGAGPARPGAPTPADGGPKPAPARGASAPDGAAPTANP